MKFHLYRGENSDFLVDAAESEKVEVHEQVKVIPYECFMQWDNLHAVQLPQGLQVIEQGAFAYCKSLQNVHMPATVKILQDMVFVDCSSLTTVWLSDALQVLEQSLFENCVSLRDVHLPLALKSIKESCFASCKSLRYLCLPFGLQRIGDWAMARCETMTSLTLPATATHVGRYCFQQCTQLLSLEFPMGLSFLGDHCFVDCSNLRSMIIPAAFEFAGSYPLLDRSLLKISFQDVQTDSYEDETLVQILNHRFESLPIHDACYHLSQYNDHAINDMESSSTAGDSQSTGLERLTELVKLHDKTDNSNLRAWVTEVDGFGMNPLHLLCLSGAPNVTALRLLLEHAAAAAGNDNSNRQAACRMLFSKDIFGATPVAYMCRNQIPGNKKLCKGLFDSIVKRRLTDIGLDSWKQVVETSMSYALKHWDDDEDILESDEGTKQLYSCRLELIGRVLFALEYHERAESLSLLECWLWKLRWNLPFALGDQQDQEQYHHDTQQRKQCRIHCGSEIVIPNVVSFLPPLKEGEYLNRFTSIM